MFKTPKTSAGPKEYKKSKTFPKNGQKRPKTSNFSKIIFLIAGPRAHGPWPMAHGPWPMAHGPGPRAHGPWPMAQGPWPMAHGPWPRAHGQTQKYIIFAVFWHEWASDTRYEALDRCTWSEISFSIDLEGSQGRLIGLKGSL